MPAAVGTPTYRHQGDEDRTHHDASPHAFSPPHPQPQLRSWYSQDSSYTQGSLHQVQLDVAARDDIKGSKRGLVPSESLPPNFGSMKLQSDDSDEKPFDPNLVCPTCRKQFRVFEIQIFKRHANECGMK